jgi:hypothetical protein
MSFTRILPFFLSSYLSRLRWRNSRIGRKSKKTIAPLSRRSYRWTPAIRPAMKASSLIT